jgi:manganese/zinc/iron transport system ATP- binding protein
MSTPALELHDLSVSYQKKPVLYGVDLSIPEGSLVGLIGPNGAGKSTLIKAVMGLLPLDGGWAKVFGEPFSKVKQRVGYVPQRESVDWDFPVNVMDVVLMGRYGRLGLLRRPGKTDRDKAREALDKVGMLPFANRQISNLSGGQQQRVFLARAGAGERFLSDGRTLRRGGCGDGKRDHHAVAGVEEAGQDDPGGAPRPDDGAGIL